VTRFPAEPAPRARARAPAAAAAAAFAGGIAAGAESIQGEGAALALAGLCMMLLFALVSRGAGGASTAAGAALFLALGFAEGRVRIAAPADAARRAFAALPPDLDRAQRVEGVLQDFWTGAPPRAHGRLQASRIWDERARRWSRFPAEVFLFVSGEDAVASLADRGDRIEAVGKLRREGVPASDRDILLPWPAFRLSIKSALRLEKPEPTALSLLAAPNRWLFSRLPAAGSLGPGFERDVRGPLAALLLGRTSELDRGLVARYRRGGMYHLLVIAGLHVGLAAGIALLLLRAMSVRGRARNAVVLATVLLFVVVGGGNPPAARAGIVCTILFAARLLERPIAPAQAIGLSALVLLAASPEQLYGVGTILTFAAVSGIAAFTSPIQALLPARPAILFSGLAAAVAAQIGTAPILLWRFNVVSAGAWLTAPFSIPVAAGLIAVGTLLLVCFAAGLPPGPLVAIFAGGSRLLEWMAERASGVAFLRPTPPLVLVVAVLFLLALAVLASGNLRRVTFAGAAGVFALAALRSGPSGPSRGFSLEALDVGQGDALLLRWRDRAILVDGGGPFDREARDFGRTHLLPKLLDRGITSLDAVVLTHPHPDHALGLFTIVEELPVGALWRSAGQDEGGFQHDLEAAALRRGVPVRVLSAGQTVRWRDASFAVLHSGGALRKKDGINNQSLVARFERDGRSALLTGDAGAAAEAEILRTNMVSRSDVLKVGHHGSRGSTTAEFLEAVSPRAALLSCGRENRFGHPAPQTLAVLAARGVPVFRTDIESDVGFELLPRATRLTRRELTVPGALLR
jgi:competence protein ComEC